MNIQFIRLDEHVCETLNRMALESRTTVSELVNEVLRAWLEQKAEQPAEPPEQPAA